VCEDLLKLRGHVVLVEKLLVPKGGEYLCSR
jgi:hypothetical protein